MRARLWIAALPWLVLACGPPPPPRHLVLVTVDTLRADHLGSYAGEPGLTPALDALAGESQRFASAYAPAPFTLPSVAAMLTGRYPDESGVIGNRGRLPEGLPTLASFLARHGFRTGAVVSNPVLDVASGLDAGFERYDVDLPDREATRQRRERIAPKTTDAALAVLDVLLAPPAARIFLWVHYQDPHGPYTPPAELRDRYLERERLRPGGERSLPVSADWRGLGAIPLYQYLRPFHQVAFYRAGYAGEVSYVDAEVGRLREGLAERGVLGRAVLIFAADHGEALGERDYWFAHGEYLDEVALRVPLLVRTPGGDAAQREGVASLVDVLPTASALLGLEPDFEHSGLDLAEPLPERPIYFTTGDGATEQRDGVLEGGYKLVRSRSRRSEQLELFRLPSEAQELSEREPERVGALLQRLETHSAGRPSSTERRLTAEEREMLRDLGYTDE